MVMMKTTVHDPLGFEVLGSGLGFTEGPVIASRRNGATASTSTGVGCCGCATGT